MITLHKTKRPPKLPGLIGIPSQNGDIRFAYLPPKKQSKFWTTVWYILFCYPLWLALVVASTG